MRKQIFVIKCFGESLMFAQCIEETARTLQVIRACYFEVAYDANGQLIPVTTPVVPDACANANELNGELGISIPKDRILFYDDLAEGYLHIYESFLTGKQPNRIMN